MRRMRLPQCALHGTGDRLARAIVRYDDTDRLPVHGIHRPLSRLPEPKLVVEDSTLKRLNYRVWQFHSQIWRTSGFSSECAQLVDDFLLVKLKHLHSFELPGPIQGYDGVLRADSLAGREFNHDCILNRMQDVWFVPELQSLLASRNEPPVMVVAGMAGILDTFGLLDHAGRRFNISGFSDPPKLRANPYRVANVFQQVRADGKVERLIRYRPRPAVTQVRLNPSLLRISRFDAEFLMDVSVAARAKFLIRHCIDHVICSRKWSSATANV